MIYRESLQQILLQTKQREATMPTKGTKETIVMIAVIIFFKIVSLISTVSTNVLLFGAVTFMSVNTAIALFKNYDKPVDKEFTWNFLTIIVSSGTMYYLCVYPT